MLEKYRSIIQMLEIEIIEENGNIFKFVTPMDKVFLNDFKLTVDVKGKTLLYKKDN